MVSDSGGVNNFRKAHEPSTKRNVGVPNNTVLDSEFMVPSNFFERRRILQVCLERGHVEPNFPCALRSGLNAADILSTEVLGVEHLHHVVVVGLRALPGGGHSASQRIQASADVVAGLFPGLPLGSIF